MAENSGRFLFGQLSESAGRDSLEVVLKGTDREVCCVPADEQGAFIAPLDDDLEPGEVLDMVVRGRNAGDALTYHRVTVPERGKPVRATFELPLDPKASDRHRVDLSSVKRRIDSDLVLPEWRTAMAALLRPHQPTKGDAPLVPRFVNQLIADLYQLRATARAILQGDQKRVEQFEQLIGFKRGEPGNGRHRGASAGLRGGANSGLRGGASSILSSGAIGSQRFGLDSLPCVLNDRGAIEIGLAGLYLEVLHAEKLGELTQPGSYATQCADYLHAAHLRLSDFGQAAHDLAAGQTTVATYEKLVFGADGTADAVPIDLPLPGGASSRVGGPGAPRPLALGPGAPSPGPLPPVNIGLTPDPSRGGPCLDIWIDCMDEITAFASGYSPPSSCSPEEVIASISPAAVCEGDEDVELVLSAVEGKQFSGNAVGCRVVLQRGLNQTNLPITAFSSEEVRVVLPKANRSGCIGFVGTSGGSSGGSPATILTCMRAARIQNRALEGLLTSSTFRQIQCLPSGANQLSVVGEPRIASFVASWSGGMAESPGNLIAEGCQDVTLEWQADFGPQESEWLDADSFLKVKIVDAAGNVVAVDQAPTGSIVVNEAEAQTYTISATASVGDSICGTTTDAIIVDRYHALHFEGLTDVQTGTSFEFTIRSSCPAPAGGIPITLSAIPSGRLNLGTAKIDAGQRTTTIAATAAGAGCESVTVMADATGHLPANRTMVVFDVPVLTSVSPAVVPACRPTQVTLQGSCFSPAAVSVRVVRITDGEITSADVVNATQSAVVVDVPALEPGRYDFIVRSWGLWSNALRRDAVASPPTVNHFIVEVVGQYVKNANGNTVLDINGEFIPGEKNGLAVFYNVDDTSRVRIRFEGAELEDHSINGACGGTVVEEWTTIQENGGTMRLDAFPIGGGSPVIREVTIGATGTKDLALTNGTTRDLVVWNISGVFDDANDIPLSSPKQDLDAGDDIELEFENGTLHHVVAIDKAFAQEAGYDPEGNAITIASLRQWEGLFRGDDDGESDSRTLIF